MSKEMTVIVLGVFVILLPFLGIPGEWRTILLVLSGAGITTAGFLLRGEVLARGFRPHEHHSFVESSGTDERHHTHEHQEGVGSLN